MAQQKTSRIPTVQQVTARQMADLRAQTPAKPSTATPARPSAPPPPITTVAEYLDSVAGNFVVGRLIKFTKNGTFETADDGKAVNDDVDFTALCAETWIGWIRFHDDGAPPDRVGGVLYDGFLLPARDTLGDTDPAGWPIGLTGAPADPWQHQMALVLQHADTSELFTFATSSVTGRRAVGNLLRHYERRRKVAPDELPVIRLKTGGFNHRNTAIGWVPVPVFAIVGRSSQTTAAKPDTSIQADINDEIPFGL